MEKIKIALDWTANTNHTGFYVAQQMGFYKENGLELQIETPLEDHYDLTPAKKLELGQVDFALCPFESILSYRVKAKPFDTVAIATLFQKDLSAIVTLGDSGINSPKDLDGRTYASYKARYEDAIVKEMVKNDGGTGNLRISYPEKLGIWETLLTKKADATWIFLNWEGVHAKNKGISLKSFQMDDYGIPYGYSPIIMASKKQALKNKRMCQKFLEATKKGFLYSQKYPREAISMMAPYVSEQDTDLDLLESQEFTAPYYGDAETWGHMRPEKVNRFIDWLCENKLETRPFRYDEVVLDLLHP